MAFVPDAPAPASTGHFVPDAPPPQKEPNFAQIVMSHVGDFIKNMPMAGLADAGVQLANRAVVKPAVGAAADLLTGGAPGAREKAANAIDVQPSTPMGAAVPALGNAAGAAIAPVVAPVGEAYKRGIENLQEAHPFAGALAEHAGRVAGDIAALLPAAGGVKQGVRGGLEGLEAARVAGLASSTAAPISETTTNALDRGWALRPSDVQKANPGATDIPGTTRQVFQDKGKYHADSVSSNQAKATGIAGGEIGVENATEITPKHLAELRAPHNQNYATAGKAAGTFSDTGLKDKLQEVVDGMSPEDNMPKAVHDIAGVYNPEALSGPSLVKSIQKLRIDGAKEMQSTGTRDQAIGKAKRAIADVLEESLSKRLDAVGDPQVTEAFQSSRQALAKIHNVEDSLTGGQIDPQKVLALRENKGAKLTDGLNEIADMAEKFPDVVRSAHGTSAGGGLPQSKTSVIGRTIGAITSKVPGLDVNTPEFRAKISAAGKEQQAARGGKFNNVKPITPVESNQGRQTDMLGDNLDLEGKKANAPKRPIANYRAKQLGDLLDQTKAP